MSFFNIFIHFLKIFSEHQIADPNYNIATYVERTINYISKYFFSCEKHLIPISHHVLIILKKKKIIDYVRFFCCV